MSKNSGNAENSKIVFFNKYKMIKISAKTFAKNCVYNIIDKEKSCG